MTRAATRAVARVQNAATGRAHWGANKRVNKRANMRAVNRAMDLAVPRASKRLMSMKVRAPGRVALRRGFTLVEVLVALMAMALLAALAWQGIDTITRTRETTREALDRTQRLSTVVTQWEQDLQAVYDTLAVPPLVFDGRSLRLTRRVDGGVVLVAWTVTNSTGAAADAARASGSASSSAGIGTGRGIWQRWVSPTVQRVGDLQDAWVSSQSLLGNEPGHLTLLQGVSEWQIYFHRSGAWSNAQSSADLAELPSGGAGAGAGAGVGAAGAGGAGGAPGTPGVEAPPAGGAATGATGAAGAGGAGAAGGAGGTVAGAAAAPAPVAALRETLPAAVRMVLTINGRTLTRDVSMGPAAGPGS
jgi:general secretion pathway protein J